MEWEICLDRFPSCVFSKYPSGAKPYVYAFIKMILFHDRDHERLLHSIEYIDVNINTYEAMCISSSGKV